MTDKQQGWNDALNIVFDQFNYIAWRKRLGQEREQAAADMGNLVENKSLGRSQDYQKTLFGVVPPFCEMLERKPQADPPFDIELPEAERQGRNDALEIVLDEFFGFAHRKGLELEWTCSEIAEDMKKQIGIKGDDMKELIESEKNDTKKLVVDAGGEFSLDNYRQAMADVVKPFYKMLRGELAD